MSDSLSYDLASLNPHDRYKILISLVIPRPIALVTTIGPTGVVNAAPFSWRVAMTRIPAPSKASSRPRNDSPGTVKA